MLDQWEPWAGIVVALWGVVAGVAVKAGRMRSLAAMSLDHGNPFWWRNIPFSLLPFSAFIVLGLIAVATPSVRVQTVPRLLKPDWLTEEERRRREPGRHS